MVKLTITRKKYYNQIKNLFSTIQQTEHTMHWIANKKPHPMSNVHGGNKMDQ